MGNIYLIKIKQYSRGQATTGREDLHTYPFYFRSWKDAYKHIMQISPNAEYVGDEMQGYFVARDWYANIFLSIEAHGAAPKYWQ